jgi:hypothetical protein
MEKKEKIKLSKNRIQIEIKGETENMTKIKTMEDFKRELEEKKESLKNIEKEIDSFYCEEFVEESQYDDFIDDMTGDIEILGMTYCASRVLKEIDPIAYKCCFSDYCDSLEKDSFPEYQDLLEKRDDLESEIDEIMEDIEELKS